MSRQSVVARPRATVQEIERIILSRVARGEYPLGSRLPTCEGLGRELGANKNTISKAYRACAQKGYTVTRPGHGTFVAARPSATWDDDKAAQVRQQLADAMLQASLSGISANELEVLALEAIELHIKRANVRVGYVDCNRRDARELGRQLAVALSSPVESLVPGDLIAAALTPHGGFDLLAVSLPHLGDVERRISRAVGCRTVVVPTMALPDAETLTKVARLATESRLLVVSDTEEILHTLAGLARGVNSSVEVSAFLSSDPLLQDALADTDAVLTTRTAHRHAASVLGGHPVLVASLKLDEQSVADVGGRLATIRGGSSMPVREPGQRSLA